jgi:hypothetical protein
MAEALLEQEARFPLTFLGSMTQIPNRRAYPRLKAPVFFREARFSYAMDNQVVDVSVGGFRIYCDDRMDVGERLELEFPLPDEESMQCQVQVAWIMELPKGSAAKFDVGLKFVDAPPRVVERLSALLIPTEGP